ncbi:metal-responsive CopG/Arc/MetJ family transcriptional regulator [Nocardiopsis mwathae]|uniref:Metal-responsive CopG/Arc/MetJ family transcriptional regulator n=1 Tax=Nocardiopsis mwathae TaxID=1472723 RepID=A0A7X0D7D4_9ACTN|nr:hypothetical protein [Nocardiopsis mwathae]MBB6173616.1 metal-responsive CopG/Arc/MetJ family transcriptional regulator [Nocardiopsis mwathae]
MATKQISIRVDENIADAIERLTGNRSQGFERAARTYLMFAESQAMSAEDEELLADFDSTCEAWRSA